MLVDAYLDRLTLASYRPATITTRRAVLHNLAEHLDSGLEGATRHDLERFLARPSLAPATRRLYRSSIRSFYAWAVEEGFLTADPAERIPPIRVKAGTPRPVSEGDFRKALMSAGPRMYAWMLLEALAGLRAMEVAGLTPADLVESERGWLLMLRETKGGAPAVVPAHPQVVAALNALPITGGLWWDVGPKRVSRAVSEHLRACGVDATGHQLRHTAATAWLRASDHDLLAVRALMRHRSVETTAGYAELDPVRPAEVVGRVRLAG